MAVYPNARETGVSWLAQIPEHWELKKIDALFSERKTIVSDKDFAPLSVTKKGILPQLEHAAKSNDSDNRKLVKAGDFVINSRSDRKGSCGVSPYDGSVSLINIVLTPRNELNSNYVHYLLHNYRFSEEYYRNGRGIVADLWTTRYSEMRTILLPVPSRAEQDQIVRFLDWKVSEINKLIGIQRKKIQDYHELKDALISKSIKTCISNGKCENVRFGQTSWIRARLGWRGLKATEYVPDGYPFLSAFNIIDNKLNWNNLNFINQFRYDESPEIKLAIGDVLLVKDGAGIGKCARVDELPKGESAPNGSLAVITPRKELSYRFLYYYLISNLFKNEMNKITTGMGVPHLTQHFLKNVNIPLPELFVQNQIADYLDAKCPQIDHAISLAEYKSKCLVELKNVIISDTVTGKIDVRYIAVPEYEQVVDIVEDTNEGNSKGNSTFEEGE